MDEKHRTGVARSAKRSAILDATQALMIERGYAAVSARNVATRAGIKPALVQYYFPSMEELLLEVYRRAAEHSIERQAAALASPRPLHTLWALSTEGGDTALAIEFMALANHRKTIRAEIARFSERARALQAEALSRLLPDADHNLPGGVSVLLAGAARALVMETNLGIAGGHLEARAIVERWLDASDPPRAESPDVH